MFSHGTSGALPEVIGRDDGKDRGDRCGDEIDSFGLGPHHKLANPVGDIDSAERSSNAECPKQNEQRHKACKCTEGFAA